jgi:DNA gyrase subunit A
MLMINSSNVAIRLNVSDISTTSRNAMGVTLMRTEEEQKVVAIAKINCTE